MSWRNTRAYRKWRAHVIRRDRVCVICASRDKRHAHHINHATYYPEERFTEGNGICLCGKCHMNFHNNFMRSYRHKCDSKDFKNFVQLVVYIRDVHE